MFLERLELSDFRCYERLQLTFAPGPRVFVGPNAQGKTNLLEAIHYLGVGGSHRTSSDAPLVRSGATAAAVRAVARVDGGLRALAVELELRPGGPNRSRVNGQPVSRMREAVGRIRSVLFAPEDVGLVRGDPTDRRRFLDDLLAQRRPAYAAARQDYERVLRQRNALLKSVRTRQGAPAATLETWTEALVRAAATLLAARIAAVHALAGPADTAYRDLLAAPDAVPGTLQVAYQLSTGRLVEGTPGAGMPDPGDLAEELRAGLAERARDELDRGVTLAGPHRDELVLNLGGLPAKGYASHGETWSIALALRLASRDVLHEVGEEPIVLLDDVFAELDDTRRARLAIRCSSFEQVLVTAAVDGDVPLSAPRHRVHAGTVALTAAAEGAA